MSILLCISIAWIIFCCLFMALGLCVLIVAERASGSRQAMTANVGIEDGALRTANFDLAAPRCTPVLEAPSLACDTDALTQLQSMMTLARHDANVMIDSPSGNVQAHTGAVIIRDQRLVHARNLRGNGDPAEEAFYFATARPTPARFRPLGPPMFDSPTIAS